MASRLGWSLRRVGAAALVALLVALPASAWDSTEQEVEEAHRLDGPETPHTRWARPLAGGPVRAYAFVGVKSEGMNTHAWEITELAQRVDLAVDASWRYPYYKEHWFGGDAGERRIVRLLEKPHDVFFFQDVHPDTLPTDPLRFARAPFSGELAGFTLRVSLVDPRGRELVRQEWPASAERKFSFGAEPWMPMLLRVEARLLAGGDELAHAWRFQRITQRKQGKFNTVLWSLPGDETLGPYALERLAELGVTAGLEHTAAPIPHAGIGFEGSGHIARTMCDPELVCREFDMWVPYTSISEEFVRSIAPRKFIRSSWIGYDRDATNHCSHAWRQVMMGADSIWYWMWSAIGGWQGFQSPNLEPPEPVREMLRDTKVVREGLGDLLLASEMQHDGVAVFYSYPSIFLGGRDPRLKSYLSHWAAYLAWQMICHDLGIQYNFVTETDLRSANFASRGYKVLVLPQVWALSDEAAGAIRRFAEAGGTVLADVRPGAFDARGKRRAAFALDDFFGVKGDLVAADRGGVEATKPIRGPKACDRRVACGRSEVLCGRRFVQPANLHPQRERCRPRRQVPAALARSGLRYAPATLPAKPLVLCFGA